jgi:hypothetical protein
MNDQEVDVLVKVVVLISSYRLHSDVLDIDLEVLLKLDAYIFSGISNEDTWWNVGM